MVPASNVSVPLTVVIRTRSKVPESVRFPVDKLLPASFELIVLPEKTQVFPVMFTKVSMLFRIEAAPRFVPSTLNPVEYAVVAPVLK